MPTRIFIAANEKSCPGYTISKDHLILLLGGNVAGNFKLKLMLVYHEENPRALKVFSKNTLPVLWHANKMHESQKFFFNYFCSETERYYRENVLDFIDRR